MNAPEVKYGLDRTGSGSVAAQVGTTPGQTTLIDFIVPAGGEFVMTDFATYYSDPTAIGTPGLYWTIFADGMPIPEYQNMRDQFGAQDKLRALADLRVRAMNRIQVIAFNDAAAAYSAGATFRGYVR